MVVFCFLLNVLGLKIDDSNNLSHKYLKDKATVAAEASLSHARVWRTKTWLAEPIRTSHPQVKTTLLTNFGRKREMEDVLQILEHANSEFKKHDHDQAEKLYTKFLSSCLQSG